MPPPARGGPPRASTDHKALPAKATGQWADSSPAKTRRTDQRSATTGLRSRREGKFVMPSAVSSALRRHLCLLALVAPLALPSGAQAAHPVGPNPLQGRQLFVDCENGWQAGARPFSAWGHVFAARGPSRALLERIARVPGTKWFAEIDSTSRLRRQVERFLAAVDHPQYGGADCRRPLSPSRPGRAAGPPVGRG